MGENRARTNFHPLVSTEGAYQSFCSSLFSVFRYKNGAAAPVDYSSTFATAPAFLILLPKHPLAYYPQHDYFPFLLNGIQRINDLFKLLPLNLDPVPI